MLRLARSFDLPVADQSRVLGVAAAGLFGLFIVLVAGFAPIEAVHNATHDTRHSMGFPCH